MFCSHFSGNTIECDFRDCEILLFAKKNGLDRLDKMVGPTSTGNVIRLNVKFIKPDKNHQNYEKYMNWMNKKVGNISHV